MPPDSNARLCFCLFLLHLVFAYCCRLDGKIIYSNHFIFVFKIHIWMHDPWQDCKLPSKTHLKILWSYISAKSSFFFLFFLFSMSIRLLSLILLSLHARTGMGTKDIRPKSGKVPAGPQVLKRLPDVLKSTWYDGDLPITQNPSKDIWLRCFVFFGFWSE